MKEIDIERLTAIKRLHFVDMLHAGWADDRVSDEHYLSLIVSEIGEAIHAHQKQRTYNGKISHRIIIDRGRRMTDITDEDQIFKFGFERYVKDTFQDELADVMLRCLCLSSMRNCEYKYVRSFYTYCRRLLRNKTFTEQAYDLICIITRPKMTIEKRINIAITYLFALADYFKFDMLTHAELKRQYNRLRTDWPEKKYN